MRICLVHGSVTRKSGSGRYIYDLATRFAEDGHRVTLLCEHCEDLTSSGAPLEVIRVPRPAERRGRWRIAFYFNLRHLRQVLPSLVGHRRFDVLLGSDLLFLRATKEICGSNVCFIYTPLSMIAPLEIRSYELGGLRSALAVRLYSQLQRWALTECARVVRFTPSAVRALEHYYRLNLATKQCVAVYVSREFEPGAGQSPPSLPLDGSRPNRGQLLWVGRLVKSKNVAFLLRAAARAQSRDWVLNICSDGPERRSLEQLAEKLGVAPRTRFLGAVDDLATQYRKASILLTASVLEQYSLTLMEAYAFAVPCIGLKPDWKKVFNSNEDQIRDGQTGFLVNDEREMASKIDYLLDHEEERRRMGKCGFELKTCNFTFEAYYQTLKALL